MSRLSLYWLLTLCCPAIAQQVVPPPGSAEPANAEHLRWLDALYVRFAQVQDPVAAIYAKAKLAALVCPLNKADGTRQFQAAFSRLKNLPADAFDKSPTVLPVDTFTALYEIVIPPAKTCNSEADWYDEKVDQRKSGERLKANAWLSAASAMSDRNPERAAQLVRAAIAVAGGKSPERSLVRIAREQASQVPPPGTKSVFFGSSSLDPSSWVEVLLQLRAASPDLSDALFQLALNAVMASDSPSPMDLGQLAAYLFPGGKSVLFYDSFVAALSEKGIGCKCQFPSMPNFMAAERKGDRELSMAFLASAVQVLQNPESTREDPDGAYALVWQLLPKARELGADQVTALEGALVSLEAAAGRDAAKIEADLGAAPERRKAEVSSLVNDAEAFEQAYSDFKARLYQRTRTDLLGVADATARARFEALIQFAEQAESLPALDADQLLNREIFPDGGAKRSLLYAAIASATSNSSAVLNAVALGLKDAQPLPMSQRACILPALTSAALPAAPDQAVAMLQEMVDEDNQSSSGSGSGGATGGSPVNGPDIRCRSTGPVEFVSTPREGKLAFPLRAPGVSAFTIEAFLDRTNPSDYSRLAPVVLELREETHLVNGLLALATVRVRTIPAP